MEFAGHEAIPRKSYDSHWVPNIDLTLHKITAKRLIGWRMHMQFFHTRKVEFYRLESYLSKDLFILSINMHAH